MMPLFSDAFIKNITSTYGTRGTAWLTQLPSLIEQCARKWNLIALTPFVNLTYNYVLFGTQHVTPVVLKLLCDHKVLQKEVNALKAFAGRGSVALLAYDSDLGALLLERAIPGNTLNSLFPHHDQEAIAITSNVIQQLHSVSSYDAALFDPLEKILPNFVQRFSILDPFIEKAMQLQATLLATTQRRVLLHGDLHYDNIVSHGDQWRSIDPHGIIGDPVYELAVCIRHPMVPLLNELDPCTIIRSRIDAFARYLDLDRQRIRDWVYVQTVASAQWSCEDGLDASNHVRFLELLNSL